MSMPFSKAAHVPFLLLVLATMSSAVASAAEPVVVKAEIVGEGAASTIRCTVTNVGRREIVKGSLGVNTNRFVLLTPGGRVASGYTIVDDFGRHAEPMIRPGETVVWTQPLDKVRNGGMGTEAGRYRLFWEFGGVRSEELTFTRDEARKGRPGDTRPPRPSASDTPKDALQSLLRAAADPHVAGINELLHARADDVGEQAVHTAFMQRFLAMVGLSNAFIGEKPDFVLEADADLMAAIEGSDVTYAPYFEEATVNVLGRRYRVLRDDGNWRVSAGSFVRLGKGWLAEFKRRTAVIREITEGLRARKLDSTAEALRELRKRLDPQPSAAAE